MGPWNYIAWALDVLFVAAIFYSLIMLARGTRAWKIFSGLVVFGGIFLLSDLLQFHTLNWLLRQIAPVAPVALVILFYPELRYALEEVGRVQFWRNRLLLLPKEDIQRLVREIVRLVGNLSASHTGALIVIEREEGLDDLIGTGVPLDAQVSVELLSTLFYPGTALHDGAVIIRGDRVIAAGCVLPLTDRPGVGSDVHTRHRAALGVTERSDAIAVVVSEETGAISLGGGGHLARGLKPDALQQRLLASLQPANARETRIPFTLPIPKFRRRKQLMQVLKHNWSIKLFCLLGAFTLSLFVQRQEDLVKTTVFLPLTVPVAFGQRVEEPAPNFRVRVELQGPGSLVRAITENDEIGLRLNTVGVKPGMRTAVPLLVSIPERYHDRVTVEWQPRVVTVRLVAEVTRVFPVLPQPQGRSEEWDFTEPPRASPTQATISGALSVVNRVASVFAPFSPGATESINETVRLQAVDASGSDITDQVRLVPAQVLVTGSQQRVVLRKWVPVQPVFQVPPGSRVNVTVEPARVRLTGPKGAAGEVYVVETEPVKLPQGQAQVSQDVALAPPRPDVQLTPNRVRLTLKLQSGAGARAPGAAGTRKGKKG
jgi:diadenylate cyclase